MFKLTQTTTRTIGATQAEALLRLNTFDGQRPLQDAWVKQLAAEQAAGNFIKGAIAFARNCKNMTRVLMNGQHQLAAVMMSDCPQRFTVDDYQYETADDLWHLFAKFDVHRARTEQHVMRAARGLFHDASLRDVPIRTLSAAGAALVWLRGEVDPVFTNKAINRAQKAELVEEYKADVLWLDEVIAKSGMCHPPVVAVVCAMLGTHRANAAKADAFWPNVLSGVELKRNSPQWHLHAEISKGISKAGLGGGGRYRHQFAMCVAWWNSYITGMNRKIVHLNKLAANLPMIERGD